MHLTARFIPTLSQEARWSWLVSSSPDPHSCPTWQEWHCCLPVLRILHYELSKIIQSASQLHWSALSALMDACHQHQRRPLLLLPGQVVSSKYAHQLPVCKYSIFRSHHAFSVESFSLKLPEQKEQLNPSKIHFWLHCTLIDMLKKCTNCHIYTMYNQHTIRWC